MYAVNSNVTFKDVNFEGCRAKGSGGSIAVVASSLNISSCSLERSTAEVLGGGVYAESSVVVINGTSIFDECTASEGGGIYFAGCRSGTHLHTTTFTNNTAFG